jgi:hypothetical protein
LAETSLTVPRKPLSVEASAVLSNWLDFSNVLTDPRSSKNQLDSALVRAGYRLVLSTPGATARDGLEIPRNPFANVRVDVGPTGRTMLQAWLSLARQNYS